MKNFFSVAFKAEIIAMFVAIVSGLVPDNARSVATIILLIMVAADIGATLETNIDVLE